MQILMSNSFQLGLTIRKEKVLSLVDDLWASLQEGPSDTTSKPSLPPSINPASLTNTKRNVITIPPLQSAPTPSTAVTPILNNNSNSTLFASSSIVNTNAPKSLAEELGQPPEEKKTFKFAGELIQCVFLSLCASHFLTLV